MAGTYLFGWDSVNSKWVKLVCDATGKLKIDPALILENPPTEDLATKAATSEWSYDHKADASAHHAKYTNAEAQTIVDAQILTHKGIATAHQDAPGLIATHKAIAAAHHAKYTDLEAQTAVNMNGNLYWSCAGVHFDAHLAGVDNVERSGLGSIKAKVDTIYFLASVNLPDGATVTGVIVYGNASAEAVTWYFRRELLTAATVQGIATAVIGTEDITISYATIDNSLYGYFFLTDALDTNDEIYGARIKYTL